MQFQDSSFNCLKVIVGTKCVMHAHTHAPKAICPINFFKVGGIKRRGSPCASASLINTFDFCHNNSMVLLFSNSLIAKFLASHCSCACCFVLSLVGNSDDRFSFNDAHLVCLQITCFSKQNGRIFKLLLWSNRCIFILYIMNLFHPFLTSIDSQYDKIITHIP